MISAAGGGGGGGGRGGAGAVKNRVRKTFSVCLLPPPAANSVVESHSGQLPHSGAVENNWRSVELLEAFNPEGLLSL